MFYSQSEAGNGLTRGLENEIAKKTYVSTKLDRDLAKAILNGSLKLVILTGNAGDGKTAFIQKLESAAEAHGATLDAKDELGSKFTLDGRCYQTLYDGSIELDNKSNHEMLTDFFESLKGDSDPQSEGCLIVAMNEGKLTDFFTKSTDFKWLGAAILDHLITEVPLPESIAIVNLNLRSVVDAHYDQTSVLLDSILDRFVANEFWEPCESCPVKHRCPVFFNVNTFRIRDTGDLSEGNRDTTRKRNESARTARSRLKSIFQILHFRKRIHVTVRDLRSVLAFTLFGKKDCDEIISQVEEGDSDFANNFYYNAIFDTQEKDRIIELIRQFDFGKSSSPMTDSRLSFMRPGSQDFRDLFLSFERSQTDLDDLRKQYDARPKSPEDRTKENLMSAKEYVVSLRRKLFFEDAREENQEQVPHELVPYGSMQSFIDFVRTGEDPDDRLKRDIVLAISRSEKVYDEALGSENICIQTRHEHDLKVRAFFTYPAEYFLLERESKPEQAEYIEFLPASIILKHSERPISLEISLDLFEILMRIRDGYIPAAGEMRTFFLNLLMFKKQLMSTPSPQLLLSGDDFNTYQLSRTPENGVILKQSN